jgi:hypothetical protein
MRLLDILFLPEQTQASAACSARRWIEGSDNLVIRLPALKRRCGMVSREYTSLMISATASPTR